MTQQSPESLDRAHQRFDQLPIPQRYLQRHKLKGMIVRKSFDFPDPVGCGAVAMTVFQFSDTYPGFFFGCVVSM